MIRGVHTMFYSDDVSGLRAFLRDQLGLPGVDVGGGWLIFQLPEADMGVHPTQPGEAGEPPSGTPDISFYCDDIRATVAELEAKGVEFTHPVEDHGGLAELGRPDDRGRPAALHRGGAPLEVRRGVDAVEHARTLRRLRAGLVAEGTGAGASAALPADGPGRLGAVDGALRRPRGVPARLRGHR